MKSVFPYHILMLILATILFFSFNTSWGDGKVGSGTWNTLREDYISDMAVANGAVWWTCNTCQNRNVFAFDKVSKTIREYTVQDSIGESGTFNMIADLDDNLWTATSFYDEKTWRTTYWYVMFDGTTMKKISSNGGNHIWAFDKYGGVWHDNHFHGGYETALMRTDQITKESMQTSYLNNNMVFISHNETIWVQNNEYLRSTPLKYCTTDRDTFEQHTTMHNLPFVNIPEISSMAENPSGVLWLGYRHYFEGTRSNDTECGVARYDGSTWTMYTRENGLVHNFISALAADSLGAIWAGTPEGVSRFDGSAWETFTSANSALTYNDVEKIQVDKEGIVWFLTNGPGGKSAISSFRYDNSSEVHAMDDKPAELILSTSPNPFNASTSITFTLPTSARAELAVYSVTGQRVRTLVSGPMTAGSHTATWDGRDDSGRALSSGVYISRLTSGKNAATGRMVMVK